jgi:tetratricopeptide (TPR) repeat protein
MALAESQSMTFGPYVAEAQIGFGGMGVVHRAHHRATLQPVAIKSILLQAPELVASFRREIHALAMLRHPGIVRILDHGSTEHGPWYAMDLVAGQSLSDRLDALGSSVSGVRAGTSGVISTFGPSTYADFASAAADGPIEESVRPSGSPLSVQECLLLCRRICRALSFLHGHGLVHRDLKPANIMIQPDGTPVLVDFGLVVQFGGARGRDVLELADTAGTFAYMAPEQRLGHFVDARADLFSLGCILYECLCGVTPFGSTGMQIWSAQAPPPPSAHNSEVPPELDALIARLLAKDPKDRLGYADDVEAALAQLDGVAGNGPERRSTYLYRSDLAGRDRVLPRLEEALANGIAGQPGVVLLTGESGGGKTRMLIELAARAVDKKMRVITGDCPPVGTGLDDVGVLAAPLRPFRQFLITVADSCRDGKPARTQRLLGDRLAVLAPYEPSLLRALGKSEIPTAEILPNEGARARLFASLGGLLVEYARECPLLLVLDDLQWADELSLEFLGWLASADAAGNAPYVVVGTCRIEEMNDTLRSLSTKPRMSRENLSRFDRSAVRQMVGGMLALPDPPESLVDFVDQESRGNPFFIAEYLRAAIEGGLLRRDAAGRWRLAFAGESAELRERVMPPPTIAAMVALRLKGLDRVSLDILSAAAVLGREFDVDLVARTADREPAAVLDAYAVLSPRNILEEDSAGVTRFAHDKLREIAYAEINAESRAELHRRAAAALEDRYSTKHAPPHLGELGYHHAKAGAPDRAANYYERAGNEARNVYANRDALRFYQLGLEQLDAVDRSRADTDPARLRLREQIGDVLLVLGKPAEARDLFVTTLAPNSGASAPTDRARRRRKLAQSWERQHRHVEALAEYSLAENELGDTPRATDVAAEWWHEYVQIQVDKAWDLYFLARVDELTSLVERVRPAVMQHASPTQKARFFQGLVQAAAKRDRFRINDETLEHSRALLEAGHQCNDIRELATARFTRAFVLSMRGEDEAAEPLFVAAIEAAQRMDDALLRTRFLSYYAIAHRRLGRLTEARATAESLLAYAKERAMFDYVGVAHANLSWCAWRANRCVDTHRHGSEALEAWEKLKPAYVYPLQWLARMPLAACLHRERRLQEALEHWRLMLEDPQHLLPDSLQRTIELALLRQDPPTVGAILEEASRFRFL